MANPTGFAMTGDEIFLTIGIGIIAVAMLWYYAVTQKRLRKLIFGSLSGLLLLYPAQWIVTSLGGVMTVNLFTTAVSALLGVPGVALLSAAVFL